MASSIVFENYTVKQSDYSVVSEIFKMDNNQNLIPKFYFIVYIASRPILESRKYDTEAEAISARNSLIASIGSMTTFTDFNSMSVKKDNILAVGAVEVLTGNVNASGQSPEKFLYRLNVGPKWFQSRLFNTEIEATASRATVLSGLSVVAFNEYFIKNGAVSSYTENAFGMDTIFIPQRQEYLKKWKHIICLGGTMYDTPLNNSEAGADSILASLSLPAGDVTYTDEWYVVKSNTFGLSPVFEIETGNNALIKYAFNVITGKMITTKPYETEALANTARTNFIGGDTYYDFHNTLIQSSKLSCIGPVTQTHGWMNATGQEVTNYKYQIGVDGALFDSPNYNTEALATADRDLVLAELASV